MINGKTMAKLSFLFQIALCSLIPLSSAALFAQDSLPTIPKDPTIETVIRTYKRAAQSGNLKRYSQACSEFKEFAKKSSAADVELFYQTALQVKPKYTYAHRVAAYLFDKNVSDPLFETQTYVTTLGAIAATTVAVGATGYAACCDENEDAKVMSIVAGLTAAVLIPLAALQQAAIYFNSQATKEKDAFDGAHQALVKFLDRTLYVHAMANARTPSTVTTGSTAPVNVEKAS
jgi:hypothetical protein